jgi:AhpD family alkylhydroperoxidase
MTAKINLFAAAPDMMNEWQKAMTQLSALASFDPTVTELVKLRVSQINGCANCINLHAIEAREKGGDRAAHLLAAGLAGGPLVL